MYIYMETHCSHELLHKYSGMYYPQTKVSFCVNLDIYTLHQDDAGA